MLKIRGPDLGLLANVPDYFGAVINEAINAEFVFSCTMAIDDKSDYIQMGNIVEVEGQYFSIVHFVRESTHAGELFIKVDCEQVTYDLINDELEDFVHAGTPAQLFALLLGETNFTIGTVEPTDFISVSINEVTNKRAVLMEIAILSGELLYEGYTIHLLNQRGQDRGVQFRYGKNMLGIRVDVDRRSGSTRTAYDIDIVELDSLEEFAGLEHFELGDTVQIVNGDLGVNEPQRIVKYEYDPVLRINSRVTITNFIDSIEDYITTVVRRTVVKDRLYYGTRIGPEMGFESIRSDKKARGVFNADTFALQKGDGSGSGWTNAVYFDTNEEVYKFTGVLEASSFLGGSIQIGTSFNVNSAGHMVAVGGEFSGEITASIITGGQINGTTITGSLIQTSASFPRSEMDVTGNYFGAFAAADKHIKISPFYFTPDEPVLSFTYGSYDTTMSQSSSTFSIHSDYIQLSSDVYVIGELTVPDWRDLVTVGGESMQEVIDDIQIELESKANILLAGMSLNFDASSRNLKMFNVFGTQIAIVNIPK